MTAPVHGRRTALIISGSVGAGHDGAAQELAHRLRSLGYVVDTRDYLHALPGWGRLFLRQGYSLTVKQLPWVFQWLFVAIDRWAWMVTALRAFCWPASRTVARWSRERPYSVVVSTYPLASQTLGRLREQGKISCPVVSYLTDPAPHRSWVHAAVDQHLTVTAEAARQGVAVYGVPMEAAGPLVPARFRRGSPGGAVRLRRELGLPLDRRVALVVTGSLGLGDVRPTVSLVLAAGLVPVVLCGNNVSLRRRVARVPGAIALGWRSDVDELMHLADVLVHNAGGLTFTEALVAGLPAVTYRCLPGHGRANAAALESAGLAPWARTPEEFLVALRQQAGRGKVDSLGGDPAAAILSLIGPSLAGPIPQPALTAELTLAPRM